MFAKYERKGYWTDAGYMGNIAGKYYFFATEGDYEDAYYDYMEGREYLKREEEDETRM